VVDTGQWDQKVASIYQNQVHSQKPDAKLLLMYIGLERGDPEADSQNVTRVGTAGLKLKLDTPTNHLQLRVYY
jgi:hypothetical protein